MKCEMCQYEHMLIKHISKEDPRLVCYGCYLKVEEANPMLSKPTGPSLKRKQGWKK